MSDDYFIRLERQLAQLTMTGIQPRRLLRSRWAALDRFARRTAIAFSTAIVLAALLVVEFPGSASGSVHRHGRAAVASLARPSLARPSLGGATPAARVTAAGPLGGARA